MAKKASKENSKSVPLDHERKIAHDQMDPRSETSCWPCKGKHVPSISASNAYGAWLKCSVCALRMEYTPRKGAPASSVQRKDPIFVNKALKLLKDMLEPGMMPNYELVDKTYQLIETENKIELHRAQLKLLETERKTAMTNLKLMVTKSKMEPEETSTSSASKAEQILQHLTPEELQEVTKRAKERMSSQVDLVEDEDDVEIIEPTQHRP